MSNAACSVTRKAKAFTRAVAVGVLALSTWAWAQGDGPEQRAEGAQERPFLRALVERRTPEELREALERKQASLREQLAAVEKARALLQEGKPVSDAAGVLASTEHPIVLEGLMEGVRERRGPFGGGRGMRERAEVGPEAADGERPGDRAGDRRAVLEVVKQELPAVYERFEDLRERDPAMAERIGERLLPRVREAMRVREGDPELFRMRIREVGSSFDVLGKIRAYRDAAGMQGPPGVGDAPAPAQDPARKAAVEAARDALRAAMQSNFDDKLALARADVARLDGRKKDVEQRMAQATEQREQLIAAAIAEIEAGRMPRPVFEPAGREGPREGGPRGGEGREGSRQGRRPD